MTLKKYLRPGEAAEYLSKNTGLDISKKDLGGLILEHKITPFFYKITFLVVYDDKNRVAYPYRVAGYFFVDPFKVNDLVVNGSCRCGVFLIKDIVQFGFKLHRKNPDPDYKKGAMAFLVDIGEEKLTQDVGGDAVFPLEYFPDRERMHKGSYEFTPVLKLSKALYDRAELDALIAKHQADSTPSPAPVAATEPAPQQTEAPPEALSAKARTTALQIIAALASYQDALDLTQHYKSADILTTHAASTGQPLPSTETVAQWLKAANPK